NATETATGASGRGARRIASMEPSRERDGDARRRPARDQRDSGFNGAVARTRRRRGVVARPDHARLIASMEPSRERDGDDALPGLVEPTCARLQWSRRANATETRSTND